MDDLPEMFSVDIWLPLHTLVYQLDSLALMIFQPSLTSPGILTPRSPFSQVRDCPRSVTDLTAEIAFLPLPAN